MKSKKYLRSIKHRIIAALLCVALLGGVLAVDFLNGYRSADNAMALMENATDSTVEDNIFNSDVADESNKGDVAADDELFDGLFKDADSSADDLFKNDDTSQDDMFKGNDVFKDEENESSDTSDTVSENDINDKDVLKILITEEENTVTIEGTDNSSDFTVSVTGDAEMLSNVDGVVVEVVDDLSTWQDAVNTIDDEISREVFTAYDITLVDENEEPINPDGIVRVSFTGSVISDLEDHELFVYHMGDNGVEDMSAIKQSENEIVFETDHFSEYALVLFDNVDEVDIDFEEHFEMNKWLEVNGTEVNGQPSATINIENAYFSNDKNAIKIESAPKRSDIIFEIDTSSSMVGKTQYWNNYLLYFMYQVMTTNKERDEKAKNNQYDDYAYNPDTFDDYMKDHYMYINGCLKYNNHVSIVNQNNDRILIRSWNDIRPLIDCECGPNNGCGRSHYDEDGLFDENVIPTVDCVFSGSLSTLNKCNETSTGGSGPSNWCEPGTRTDLASKQALSWVRESIKETNQVSVILLTDGEPYSYGPSGTIRDGVGTGLFGANANDALNATNQMKALGATIYVGYDCGSKNHTKTMNELKTMTDDDGFKLSKRHADGTPYFIFNGKNDNLSDVIFMSMYSSDYDSGIFITGSPVSPGYGNDPVQGAIIDTINPDIKLKLGTGSAGFSFITSNGVDLTKYVEYANGNDMAAPFFIYDYAGNYKSYNTFGEHTYAISALNSATENIASINSIQSSINHMAVSATNSIGYGGVDSYIMDEITDPFTAQSIYDIQVFKVPRIPKALDENGIPVKLDASAACDQTAKIQYLDDDDFRWGEELIDTGSSDDIVSTTEWIEITDSVTIDSAAFAKGQIIISGIDYEHSNSVRNFDVDYLRPAGTSVGNGLAYNVGDYGYKVIVKIPIVSDKIFGGNNIKTNNTDISGFYPGSPRAADGEKPRPIWIKNTDKNPEGNAYIGLYPECKMNLKVNYDIVADNAIIYAPEQKNLHDLLTDTSNFMWNVDDTYFSVQTELNLAMNRLNDLQEKCEEALNGELLGDESLTDIESEVNSQIQIVNELNDQFNRLNCYVPNGRNNAFVDIKYTFTSPSGKELANMYIPHGKSYYADEDGNHSINWNMLEDKITESGIYMVSATVTPVHTEKSPTWHVYTETDSADEKAAADHSILNYSATGSDGVDAQPNNTLNDIGPSGPHTITKNPEAYIFRLMIMGDDSLKESNEIIDINRGVAESIIGLASLVNERDADTGIFTCKAETQTHIRRYQWICTDGTTPSDPENEPVNDADVMVLTKIPESIIGEKGLVKDTNGSLEIIAEDGSYVPVHTTLSRKYRLVSKDENHNIWSDDTLMSDYDNLYGDGVSSVVWEHECDKVGTCLDDDGEFKDAVKLYGKDTRYLIHVLANVPPEISKTADKELISPSEKFKWTITVNNDDEENNPNHRESRYTVLDVLPHTNDNRNTALYPEGSSFHGVLKYDDIAINFVNAPSAFAALKNGDSKMYFTGDAAVNTYPDVLSPDDLVDGGVIWKEAPSFGINGNVVTFSGLSGEKIYAFKFETKLAFGETILINMTADTENIADKEDDDFCVNEAYIYQGKGFIRSERSGIRISPLSVSGFVWDDSDYDGTYTRGEDHVKGISLGLYAEKADVSLSIGTLMREFTLPGSSKKLELVKAYDKNDHAINSVTTAEDGSFIFTNLKPGKYYIVADYIPLDHGVVEKHRGDINRNGNLYDSEAEEYFLDNGDDVFRNNTAIITEINVGLADDGSDSVVTGMNIGIVQLTGTVRVGKCAEIMKIPQTFTDDQRADFKVPVMFYLKNKNTGEIRTQGITLTEQNYKSVNGKPQVWVTFENVPIGSYEIYENTIQGNKDIIVHKSLGLVTINGDRANVELNKKDSDAELWFSNHLIDGTYSYNHMNIRTPVKLDIKYHDNGPIGIGSDLKSYVFKKTDFDDIIVTYDDGTTISLSAGTLRFEDITLTPGGDDNPITRFMNTGADGKPIIITGFYSERGHIVSDTYPVRVALKELYKFTVQFDCNYDTTDNGKNKAKGFENDGFKRNTVTFLYDEDTKKTEVTNGIYKDAKNKKLDAPSYKYGTGSFTQYGWNTKTDASGTPLPFDVSSANNVGNVLEQIGDYMYARKLSDMVWYADWKGTMTFDANGTVGYNGFLVSSSNSTSQEKAGAGKKTVQITFSKNQPISTTLVGRVSNPQQEAFFDHWNFYKENKAGYDLVTTNPPTFQGGEIYYAIYYVTEFKYTGKGDVFTAPTDGSYTFQLWGSPGGFNKLGSGIGGNGGYTQVTMNLKRGQNIYAFVGSAGASLTGSSAVGGYNGGGPTLTCPYGPHSASGGGATHISYVSNPIISDLIVDVQKANGEHLGFSDKYSDTPITLKTNGQTESIAWVRNEMKKHPYYGRYINDQTTIFAVPWAKKYVVICHAWDNIDKVIAVAGGGGGGGGNGGGAVCPQNTNGALFGYAGGDIADKGRVCFAGTGLTNSLIAANNNTNTGYSHGSGQYMVQSSGGGGGWYGGYSNATIRSQSQLQSSGCICSGVGGGGTGYVKNDERITSSLMLSGNDTRIYSDNTYQKPATEGVNGYIKVIKH